MPNILILNQKNNDEKVDVDVVVEVNYTLNDDSKEVLKDCIEF